MRVHKTAESPILPVEYRDCLSNFSIREHRRRCRCRWNAGMLLEACLDTDAGPRRGARARARRRSRRGMFLGGGGGVKKGKMREGGGGRGAGDVPG